MMLIKFVHWDFTGRARQREIASESSLVCVEFLCDSVVSDLSKLSLVGVECPCPDTGKNTN